VWVVRALEAAPGAPELIRAMALYGAGLLAEDAIDYDQALVYLREALAISRAVGRRTLEGWVLVAMGVAAWDVDVDARPPMAWFDDALRIFRESDEPAGIGWALSLVAEERFVAGDMEGATSCATEAFDVSIGSGWPRIAAEARRVLAIVAAQRGQHAEAERLFEEVASVHEQTADRWQLTTTLTMAAHLALGRGDDVAALASLRRALRLARDIGSRDRMTYAVDLTAYLLHRRGRAREAATLLGAVEAVTLRFPRRMDRTHPAPFRLVAGVVQSVLGTRLGALASGVSAGLDEHRVAGRNLSLERAADLALRVLDEELALAPTPAAGGSEAERNS
jgi:tetratricopeptide (TPR) repeat protein